MQKKLD